MKSPRLLLGACLLLGTGAASSCARSLTMVSSAPSAPSEGKLTVVDMHNGIRVIRLSLTDLASPTTADADARVYVVWTAHGSELAQNLGLLRLEGGQGLLEAVAPPYDHFSVFVTPEKSEDVTTPSHPPMFFADIVR